MHKEGFLSLAVDFNCILRFNPMNEAFLIDKSISPNLGDTDPADVAPTRRNYKWVESARVLKPLDHFVVMKSIMERACKG